MRKHERIIGGIVATLLVGGALLINRNGLEKIISPFRKSPAETFFEEFNSQMKEGTTFSYKFSGYGEERLETQDIELSPTETRRIDLNGIAYDPEGIQRVVVKIDGNTVYTTERGEIGDFRNKGYTDPFPNLNSNVQVFAEKYSHSQGKIYQSLKLKNDRETMETREIGFRLNLDPKNYRNNSDISTITSTMEDRKGNVKTDSFDIIPKE